MGYVALVVLFVGMTAFCLAFAVRELARPADPGPLLIDTSRDIADRHFARRLAAVDQDPLPASVQADPRVVAGDRGDDRLFVAGDAVLARAATAGAIAAGRVLTLARGARVLEHADGAWMLVLERDAAVRGRATSEGIVVLHPGAEVRHAAGRRIVSVGGRRPWTAEDPVSPSFEELDELWRRLRSGEPIDRIVRSLRPGVRDVSGIEALRALEGDERIPSRLVVLRDGLAPSWLAGRRGWYLGAATARVRGDLRLPPGACVPFNLVVDGHLRAGPDVRFHGGVRVARTVELGRGSLVFGSLVAAGVALLDDDCEVRECLWGDADVELEARCVVGAEGVGGLAARGVVRIGPGTVVHNRLYAERGAQPREASGNDGLAGSSARRAVR